MLEQLHIHRLSLLKKLKKSNVHSLFLLLKLIQFSHLELRHQTEDELAKLNGVRYQVDLFSGVTHGFAVRGDINNPIVKYAKEKLCLIN